MLHPQEVSTAGWSAHTFGVSAFVPQSIVLVQVTVHSSKMGWGEGRPEASHVRLGGCCVTMEFVFLE